MFCEDCHIDLIRAEYYFVCPYCGLCNFDNDIYFITDVTECSRYILSQYCRDDYFGKIDVLFSTRAARGIDFPGKECCSIVFTKYPNPNVQDAFWRILMKTKPEFYWDFYKDKANRELWQKIYRGLRFKEDHIYLLSPDLRVLNAFEN